MNSGGTAVAAWTNELMMVSMSFVGSGWTAPLAFNSGYPRNYFPDGAISDGGNYYFWCDGPAL